MQRPLSHQKRIDTLAVAIALLLALLIALASSLAISIAASMLYARGTPEGIDDSVGGGAAIMLAFFSTMIFLSPLWLWLGFRLRRALQWPKGAFDRTTRVTE